MSNSRRRFLAFLGLAGAPAALWAASTRAQTTAGTAVNCTAVKSAKTTLISYKRGYTLLDGKLTPQGERGVTLRQRPLKASYSAGYSRASVASGDDGFDYNDTSLSVKEPDGASPTATFITRIRSDEGYDTYTIRAGKPGKTTLIDVAVGTPVDLHVYDVQLTWPANWNTLGEGVTIEITGHDGTPVASFKFDLSTIKYTSFLDEKDKSFQAWHDVSVNSTTGTVSVSGSIDTCQPPSTGAAGCFFTTAAVETLGMSDDCWELRTLRAFRDGPLARTPEGQALTARYYAQAPRLVAGINGRRDADRVWLGVYWTHILPCAVMARLGRHRATTAHYTRLFLRLEQLA